MSVPDFTLVRMTAADADDYLDFRARNLEFFRPFDPIFAMSDDRVAARDRFIAKAGDEPRWRIDVDGEFVGQAGLSNITTNIWQNCTLGYSVDERWNGRGLATAAVGRVLELAFGELGRHRVEAGTLVDNVGSQRVLEKNGFARIGVSRYHLPIAGAWRDHVLFSCTPELRAEFLEQHA